MFHARKWAVTLMAAWATAQALGTQDVATNSVSRAAGRDFVGSPVCMECHPQQGNSWRHSLHARFMRTPEEDERSPVVDWASEQAAPFDRSKVAYIFGNMYKLVFLRATEQGHTFLPREFDIGTRTWEDFDANRWISLTNAAKDDSGRPWETLCAGCHVTGFDASTGAFVEPNIGCENCHGPGRLHAASKKRDDIINPSTLEGDRAEHVCARCHSQGHDMKTGRPYPVGFTAGDDLTATFALDRPSIGTNAPGFWGNGMARTHHAQYNEFQQSRHYGKGVRCFDCHQVHRSRESPSSENTRLMAFTERFFLKKRASFSCMTCHADRKACYTAEQPEGAIVESHTHHPALIATTTGKSEGKRAVSASTFVPMLCQHCHMVRSAGRERGYETSSHSFHVPEPQDTVAYAAPNACNNCHTGKTAPWAVERIAEWRKQRAKNSSAPFPKAPDRVEDPGVGRAPRTSLPHAKE